MEASFPLYLSHVLLCDRTHPDTAPRTQNPVVRKHRVGSSPTSGTRVSLQNRRKKVGERGPKR